MRKWCVSLINIIAILLGVIVAFGFYDIRISMAIAMILAVLMPMAWILAVDRLMTKTQSLASPTRFTIDLSSRHIFIETFRRTFPTHDKPESEYIPVNSYTFTPDQYVAEPFNSEFMAIKTEKGVYFFPCGLWPL